MPRSPRATFKQIGLRGLSSITADKNAAYYAYPEPWVGFRNVAIAQYPDLDPRNAISSRLQYDLSWWKSKAANAEILAGKITDVDLRDKLLGEAIGLQGEISEYEAFPDQAVTMDTSTLINTFRSFNDVMARIHALNYTLELVTPGISAIDREAAERAREIAAKFTQSQMDEVREKGGFWSDESYIALLKQQVFMTELARQYSKELGKLGPDSLGFINDRIAENERLIEDSKPSFSSALIDEPMETLKKSASAARAALPSFPGSGLVHSLFGAAKAGLLVTGGLVLLTGWLIVKGIRSVGRR